MKNIVRKLFSIILAIAVVMSIPAYTANAVGYANTITVQDIENLMDGSLGDLMLSVKSFPEDIGLTQAEVSDAYLGKTFSIAELNEENEYESVSDVVYIPLISSGDIIAIFTIIKENGRFNCTAGIDFAEQLDLIMKSSNGNVALVSENMDIIAVDSSSTSRIVFDAPSESVAFASKNKRTYSDACRSNNTITANEMYSEQYTLPSATLPATREYNFLDYPIVFQGNYSICWAAVAASMIMYEMPSQYPELYATTVCNTIGHSYTMGQPEDVIDILEAYLPSIYAPTTIYAPLTQNEVKAVIQNNDPACMFALPDHHMIEGHCTALCGYRIVGSTFEVRYMCPMLETIKLMTYDSVNGCQYQIGSFTFYWVYTTRLYYYV